MGLQNFLAVMGNPVFRRALGNTFIFTAVSQVAVIALGNLLARALMKKFWGRGWCGFILMPWAAPVSLAALGWLWIFDSTFSVINWMLKVAGLHDWPEDGCVRILEAAARRCGPAGGC